MRIKVRVLAARAIVLTAAILAAALTACAPTESPTHTDLQAVTLAGTYTPEPSPTPGPRLVTATPSSTAGCPASEVAARLRAIPAYTPGAGSWVTVDGASFSLDGERWIARGVNYYPADAPWQRFTADNPNARTLVIGEDFGTLHEAGLNTVRVFLWYDGFFVCPGSGAVPDLDAVLWLDGIFRLAATFDLRLILTLNHLPDSSVGTQAAAPLYDDPGLTLAQTSFLVRRYRDEPRLLAWDVRDAGDTDYSPSVYGVPLLEMEPVAERAQVLDWLARTAAAIRTIDTRHPITAGWSQDSAATVDLVNVVSLQHYGDAISLRARIAELRTLTGKPLLLIAVGASSFGVNESDQARRIDDALRVAQADDLAGWLVWTMHDFPTSVTCWPDPCASFDDIRHHFGLWTVDSTPKPAAGVVATQAAKSSE